MIVNVNSVVQQVIQIKNGIMLNVNGNDYSWNPSTSICEGI